MKLLKQWLSHLTRKVGKHKIHTRFARESNTRRTLDLGCGHSPLAASFPNRIGTDYQMGRGVEVIADAHALPFDSETFEQIVCSEVLEHLAEPSRAVDEMARILEADGDLLLSMPFVYPLHEAPHDYQRFTLYGLRRLFERRFDLEAIEALYSEEETLAILVQRIAFQRDDGPARRYLYLLIAHILFRFAPRSTARRFQGLGRDQVGPFMTAGYFLKGKRS